MEPTNAVVLADILELEGAQIIHYSTDTATADEDGDSDNLSFTPEEIVLRRLQVTPEEQSRIEQATIGQHLNGSNNEAILWKGQPSPLVASNIVIGLHKGEVQRPHGIWHWT